MERAERLVEKVREDTEYPILQQVWNRRSPTLVEDVRFPQGLTSNRTILSRVIGREYLCLSSVVREAVLRVFVRVHFGRKMNGRATATHKKSKSFPIGSTPHAMHIA